MRASHIVTSSIHIVGHPSETRLFLGVINYTRKFYDGLSRNKNCFPTYASCGHDWWTSSWEFSVWSWGKICSVGSTHPYLVMGVGGTQLSMWEARMLVRSNLRVVRVVCGWRKCCFIVNCYYDYHCLSATNESPKILLFDNNIHSVHHAVYHTCFTDNDIHKYRVWQLCITPTRAGSIRKWLAEDGSLGKH